MREDELRRAAVDRAHRDHVDDVYRVAFAILREPEAAADSTHDAFARAFSRWHQYDTNRPLRAWLHGIAVNTALDTLRRRRVRDRAIPLLGRVAEIGTDPGTPDPGRDVVRRLIVDEGLATLTPAARAAVVLRHYYGYDYAEIAGFLRTTPGNVGSILSRAHADLRRRLIANEPSPGTGSLSPAKTAAVGAGPIDRPAS